jgi:predicted RNase H-like nuclease/5'-deoxynucleotidase YfbR-like HD superfamily hydrolase
MRIIGLQRLFEGDIMNRVTERRKGMTHYPSHCIMTYSRVLMDPLNARSDQILIEDIAHSLSLMTRANGHCRQFYSVAQHSINCALEARSLGLSPRVQLACLLHDAAEAYISDIPRPVKRRLSGFAEIEENMQRVIFQKFGLSNMTEDEWEAVARIDDALLHAEFRALMGIPIFETAPYLSQAYDFGPQDMDSVYRAFIRVFRELTAPPAGADVRKVVGVDGCKGGWAAVALTGNRVDIEVFASVSDLFAAHADAERFLIDMPIGLPESPDDLRPEAGARAMLRGKASSVFNCPCRQAVYASAKDASAVNREVLGKSLSAQSVGIIPKIRELDEYLAAHADIRPRVFESHPELCFAKLSGAAVQEGKRTPEGQQKRLDILSPLCPAVRGAVEHAGLPKKQAAPDDLIDAACLAVVAWLSLERPLKTVPERPKTDAHGLKMQMVYAERGE